MKRKAKARIALGVAGALAASLALGALCLAYLENHANVDPSPSATGETSQSDDGADAQGDGQTSEDGFPVVDWDYWQEVNPDVIGWVTVPGTAVDCPIVQATADDPDYYLTHDVSRDYNVFGCPYLDAGCTEGGLFGSMNAVVFGHNMSGAGGSMFTAFSRYSGESYAREHATVLVQTPDEKRTYAVQGVEVIPGWEAAKRTSFGSLSDFRAWYAERLDDCTVRIGSEAVLDADHVMTFCTCSYSRWPANERTLVYAAPS